MPVAGYPSGCAMPFPRPACLFVASALLAGAGWAGTPPAKVEMFVQLPPFIVEQPRGWTWRYTEFPGGEVLSNCDDGRTREMAWAFHRANRLLDVLVPPRFQRHLDVPQALIFVDQRLWAQAERAALETMHRTTGPNYLSGLPVPDNRPEGTFYTNLTLSDVDAITTFTLVTPDQAAADEANLTPAFVGDVIRDRQPQLPVWFTSAFLRLYPRLRFSSAAILLRATDWEFSRRFVPARKGRRPASELLPPTRLFDEGSLNADTDVSAWLDQAELFVAWGLDPAGGRAAQFWRFLDRSATAPVTEDLFRECFGLDFTAANAALLAYAAMPHAIEWPLPDDLRTAPAYSVRDANSAEIARIKGEWERLEARYVHTAAPALEADYIRLARQTLHRALDRGLRDPRAVASLGLLELEAGDRAAARDLLAEAVHLRVVRPRAYFELARLRYHDLRARSPRDDGRLTAEETVEVTAPLLVALQQAPPLLPVARFLVHVALESAAPPSADVLTALAATQSWFPRQRDYLSEIDSLRARAVSR